MKTKYFEPKNLSQCDADCSLWDKKFKLRFSNTKFQKISKLNSVDFTYYTRIFGVLYAIVNINFVGCQSWPIVNGTQILPVLNNSLNSTTVHWKYFIENSNFYKWPVNQTSKALNKRVRRQYIENERNLNFQPRFYDSHNNAHLFQNVLSPQTFPTPQSNNANQFSQFQSGPFNPNHLPPKQSRQFNSNQQFQQQITTTNNLNQLRQSQKESFNPSQLPVRQTELLNSNQKIQHQKILPKNNNLLNSQLEKNLLYNEASPPGRLNTQNQQNNIDQTFSPQLQYKPNKRSHSYYFPPKMPLPLPSCFYNPTGYACCNLGLNDLIVETYTELKTRPKFHTCNINAIASMLQIRAEKKYNTTFETIASFDDFAQKVHFNGDLVCKVELGGKFMLAYGTAKNAAASLAKNNDDAFSQFDFPPNDAATIGPYNSIAVVKSARQKRSIVPLREEEVRLPLHHISQQYSMWI